MNQETEFLQSEDWLVFQEAAGKKTVRFSDGDFSANGIIHELPVVGKYLYVPRGPVVGIGNPESGIRNVMWKFLEKAEESGAAWVRIEPKTEALLADIRRVTEQKIVKAPHNTQPRETFVVDISRSEEELLADMKPKTRYNIRLAEKRGVKVFATREEKYSQAFLDLMQATADRKEIVPHPRAYYEKFLIALPEEVCRLFVAEYDGQILAANLLMISGMTATYLHGGSGDRHRDMMAPYLLQWEQMRFAKAKGCALYDFGGVKITDNRQQTTDNDKKKSKGEDKSAWTGITRFKLGFSPKTAPTVFPGGYDIVLDTRAYFLYERLRLLKESLIYMRKFFTR